MKRTLYTKELLLGASLVLVVIVPTISEMARPGTVLCPLRRAGEAMGIPMEKVIPAFLDKFTGEDRAQADEDAAKWKAAALEKFPNLRIEPRPLPPEENGFWQLHRLDKNPLQPTAALRDVLGQWEQIDEATAQNVLTSNKDWMAHIESIAAMSGRSSIDLPGGPVDFFSVSPMKQAVEMLLLRSVLAAKTKDEAGALRFMQAAGNLIDHLHKVETPTLLTETACILCHQLRLKTIFTHVLPTIGPSAKRKAWEAEMQRIQISPSHLAILLRGEWHVGCDTMTYPMLALSHGQRRLIDPEAVAMAHAELTSGRIDKLRKMNPQDALHLLSTYTAPSGLSHEGRGWMEIMHVGMASWANGYFHTARVAACHQAAMDLLQIEPCQGDLSEEDAKYITLDPFTGKPFVFDPYTRTLHGPDGGPEGASDVEVKLPWKTPY